MHFVLNLLCVKICLKHSLVDNPAYFTDLRCGGNEQMNNKWTTSPLLYLYIVICSHVSLFSLWLKNWSYAYSFSVLYFILNFPVLHVCLWIFLFLLQHLGLLQKLRFKLTSSHDYKFCSKFTVHKHLRKN